jgi:mono/diheme cytochrome c family protein
MKTVSLAAWLTCGVVSTIGASIAQAADGKSTTLKRGEYLVTIGGCHDCHTPMKMGAKGPEPDMGKMLSGHPAELKMPPAPDLGKGPWLWAGAATNTAFAGPWGVTYSANLTADKGTGLGSWKVDDFVKAMRTGKHAGVGREIMPPMPWQSYARMTDSDLRAIFAYLQSVPVIRNAVPDYAPPRAVAGKG